MPANGPYLIALTLGSIVLLLILILAVKLHAFLALILSSMVLGLAAGMQPQAVLKSIQAGFGDALGFIAVVVGLGAMIGQYLEHSGGGRALADWLLEKFGRDRAAWAVLAATFLVGLPIFFEVGFIIMVPLVWSLARESKRSLLLYGLPMTCALTVTHALVPPHPAPAGAAQLLGADLGRTILYGIAVSIPMAIAGGIFYGGWMAKRMFIPVPAMASTEPERTASQQKLPSVPLVLLLLTLPVLFIFAATLAGMWNVPGKQILGFFGHPFTALLVTALAAMFFLGLRRGLNLSQISRMATDSLAPTGSLLVIMGGGGAFKQVIVDSGVGPYAGNLLASSNISPLIVAYLIAAAMRIAQGSATVAIITAAGIVAPLMKAFHGYSPEFIVLAVCCGGTVLSHVNDAGFWLVNQYFGMTVPQTLQSWSSMKIVVSLVGFAIVLAAHALLR
ncbi:MAG TPA: gluconate:H+ symporter [Bryobacteraceae bacterium]|jgi:gluconate transporter|nr:gluconate:H+ symporter [Bryobacteraceae bacterium]